jgi:hypothetical protein
VTAAVTGTENSDVLIAKTVGVNTRLLAVALTKSVSERVGAGAGVERVVGGDAVVAAREHPGAFGNKREHGR